MLHEGLKVKLDNLIVGQNTRQLSIVGVNKIKDMIKTVGWVPHKGIMYAMPVEEHAVRCEQAFQKYDFSKVVGKVITILVCTGKVHWHINVVQNELTVTINVIILFYFIIYLFIYLYFCPDSGKRWH